MGFLDETTAGPRGPYFKGRLLVAGLASLLATVILVLPHCDFENRFNNRLDMARKANQPVEFNLDEITYFEWVKMLHVDGGGDSESVSGWVIAWWLGRDTTAVVGEDTRFYFMDSQGDITIRNVGRWFHNSEYDIGRCRRASEVVLDSHWKNDLQWLSKDECNFTLRHRGSHVLLSPSCKGTGIGETDPLVP